MAGFDAMTAADQLIATTPVTDRVNLLGLTRHQLEAFFTDLGEKRFRAQQVMKWIHHRGVRDFEEMTAVDLGVAISEAQSQSSRLLSKVVLRGGGFQKEGTFTARLVLPSDDEDALPQPVSIELFDDDTDDAAAAAAASKSRRKRKKLPKSDKGFTAEKA